MDMKRNRKYFWFFAALLFVFVHFLASCEEVPKTTETAETAPTTTTVEDTTAGTAPTTAEKTTEATVSTAETEATETTEEPKDELPQVVSGDIHSMLQQGFIAAISVGESIMRNVLQVQNKTDLDLEITLPFGTYFASNSGNVQNMLAREEKSFFVAAGQIAVLYVEVACMNIYRDIPGDKNYFTVAMLAENSRLIKLLKAMGESAVSYEVVQAAVWHIADNPGKEAILGALVHENGEYAIKGPDYEAALRLVELADSGSVRKTER